eukprot:5056929-Pleurochrysis_carterae.AAC.1
MRCCAAALPGKSSCSGCGATGSRRRVGDSFRNLWTVRNMLRSDPAVRSIATQPTPAPRARCCPAPGRLACCYARETESRLR